MTTQPVGMRGPASLPGGVTGGIFGGVVAALLAIPTAGALQVLVKEVWQATAPDEPQESPAPAAEPADEYRNPAGQRQPANPGGPSGRIARRAFVHSPAYAVEPAPPGVARRGTGRP